MIGKQNLDARKARRGTVAVFVAVSLIAILSIVALTVDGGGMYTARRSVQAGADAAALAAAADLFDYYWINSGADPSGTAKASALATAAANGFDNDGSVSTVEVYIPPKTGYFAGKRGYVEVVIEYKFDRGMSALFSSSDVPIRARAVALGAPIAADVGILVLHPTNRASLNAQGSGTTTVKDTPIVVNSSDSAAVVVGGGGILAADKLFVKGGYELSGGGQILGPVITNRPGIEDPLKDIPYPNKYEMTQQSNRKYQYSSGDHYLQPGVYKGGINVSGTGNLYLAPGIYYMDGGGFNFSGQGSLVGHNVMIFNDPGNGNSDTISVTGQGSMVLTGPTSGPYQGLTFFQRRDAKVTGTVAGTGGQTSITGTFYFAGALLKVSGNGGVANIGSQYISNELYLGGNGNINIDWKPDEVARKRSIHLVE